MARTTRVFKNGNLQAARLPKDFQFGEVEAEIIHRSEKVVLRKKQRNLAAVFHLLISLPRDFMASRRVDTLPEKRRHPR